MCLARVLAFGTLFLFFSFTAQCGHRCSDERRKRQAHIRFHSGHCVSAVCVAPLRAVNLEKYVNYHLLLLSGQVVEEKEEEEAQKAAKLQSFALDVNHRIGAILAAAAVKNALKWPLLFGT